MAERAHRRLASAQRDRDAALKRIARVRRATILGTGGLTVALAGVVSAVAPGHTLRAKTRLAALPRTTSLTARRPSALRMPRLASASQLGLQAPGSAPQPGPQSTTPAPPPSTPGQSGAPSPAPSGPPAPTQPAPQAAPAPAPAPQAPAPAPQPAVPSAGGVVSGGS